ncbi:nuclear transport factor 2 family protein [Kordia sp. YSTF-M3]|uniref:Nuclear transport factor 2 family protein n=1 Tax=Kordia aestuariivivens TaxID=2759037 RepID=A0ABR7QGI9_9FLAO|nr:nuclear transport factor 2 family protein [Kordia aestuariivivens]MBC8757414.1 nuclear transport factor 2 family protein [Kordia aestuariivivens]
MNKEHPNISILKRFNPANPSTVSEVLAKDFIWHYINPELPEFEGDYIGLSGLMDFFQKLAGRTSGSFKVNTISATPIGDEIVIAHVKDTMLLDGKPMEIDAIVVWCIMEGEIKEAWDIPIVRTAKMIKPLKEKQ